MPRNDEYPEITPEFSRPVDVTSLGSKGRYFKFQANEAEKTALARRYSVLSVDDLYVDCRITPAGKGSFRLAATYSATVIQSCGISLTPVAEKISEEFTLTLQHPSRQRRKEFTEIDFSPEEEDTEFLASNLIDVGEMTAQQLSLEINPYPRRQNVTGVELGQKIIQEEDQILAAKKKTPFAVLKSLKHKA